MGQIAGEDVIVAEIVTLGNAARNRWAIHEASKLKRYSSCRNLSENQIACLEMAFATLEQVWYNIARQKEENVPQGWSPGGNVLYAIDALLHAYSRRGSHACQVGMIPHFFARRTPTGLASSRSAWAFCVGMHQSSRCSLGRIYTFVTPSERTGNHYKSIPRYADQAIAL